MREEIKKSIKNTLKNIGIPEASFSVEHPEDFKNGDYSTNVALVTAKQLKKNPKEIAEKIKSEIVASLPKQVEKVEVAGAGFINFYLSKEFFKESVAEILNNKHFAENHSLRGKKIMIEYTDPNPFKPFHIGHLMTNAIGESISRILETSGAEVKRANYQGDVGLHVAKAIYQLVKDPSLVEKGATVAEQAHYIGEAYAKGAEEYENNKHAQKEIDGINQKIYNRTDEKINEIYDWGFKVTMKAFEDIYDLLGTRFDLYFLESQMAGAGERIVRDNTGRVFEESDGAVVFRAEKYESKLHTRVFITSQGLPTYEAKELGLTENKFENFPNLNLSIVVTAREQAEYMKVVAKALEQIHPDHAGKMLHITHGMMRFASGKMSSRKGNVVTGEALIEETRNLVVEKIKERDFDAREKEKITSSVAIAAIKYSILKQSTGGDIIYDIENSISFEGNSGPYLQYSHARARSVLEKAQKENILPDFEKLPKEVMEVEKLMYRFPEIVHRAAEEYEPHYISNFLIDLARSYNSFYAGNVIVDKKDETSPYKVALTYAFTFVMKKGLHLLGIVAPEKM